MVIQRWQSVWLLVAAVLTGVFCFVPMAIVPGAADADSVTFLNPKDMPVFMIVGLLTALLFFLSIFLYKNPRRQKTLVKVSAFLLVVLMAVEAGVLLTWDTSGGSVEWLGSVFLLAGGFVFAIMAYQGIRRDEKLLRAADRIR